MILVTGGAGFIGSNFINNWFDNSSDPVINLDKLTYAGNPANIARVGSDSQYVFVRGEIGDGELVGMLLSKYKPRAIVNFAAESHVDRSIDGPHAFIQTNVVETSILLETTRHYWSNMKEPERSAFRFLHVSTDEVYGTLEPNDLPFTEHSNFLPNSPYAASKAAGDHLVRAWHHTYGVPVLTTNCSNNYGPRQFPEKLIPLIILNALAGKDLPVYGDGLQVRDWLYVIDHCNAIKCVLEHGEIGQTYNVGGRNEMTNIEIVKTICDLLDELRPRAGGGTYREQIEHVADRPGHDRRYAVNASKIEKALGWQPAETFATGIRKTITWYLDNPQWMESVQSAEYRKWVDHQYQVQVT